MKRTRSTALTALLLLLSMAGCRGPLPCTGCEEQGDDKPALADQVHALKAAPGVGGKRPRAGEIESTAAQISVNLLDLLELHHRRIDSLVADPAERRRPITAGVGALDPIAGPRDNLPGFSRRAWTGSRTSKRASARRRPRR